MPPWTPGRQAPNTPARTLSPVLPASLGHTTGRENAEALGEPPGHVPDARTSHERGVGVRRSHVRPCLRVKVSPLGIKAQSCPHDGLGPGLGTGRHPSRVTTLRSMEWH